jgi:hypothetical protein
LTVYPDWNKSWVKSNGYAGSYATAIKRAVFSRFLRYGRFEYGIIFAIIFNPNLCALTLSYPGFFLVLLVFYWHFPVQFKRTASNLGTLMFGKIG